MRIKVNTFQFLFTILFILFILPYNISAQREDISYSYQKLLTFDEAAPGDYVGKFYACFTYDTIYSITFSLVSDSSAYGINPSTGMIFITDTSQLNWGYDTVGIEVCDGDYCGTYYAVVTVKDADSCVFVDPGNSGAQSGSFSQPWSTWGYIKEFKPGFAYLQRRNTVEELNMISIDNARGTPSRPISVGAYGAGMNPVIDRSEEPTSAGIYVGAWGQIGSCYVNIYDFIVRDGENGIWFNSGTDAHHNNIYNCEVYNCGGDNGNIYFLHDYDDYHGGVLNFGIYNTISHNAVSSHGIKTQRTVDFVNCYVYDNGRQGISVHDLCTFRYVYSRNNVENGIEIQGENSLIENCVTHSNEQNGIRTDEENYNYHTIRACESFNNAFSGISIYGSDYVTIEDCRAHHNELRGIQVSYYSNNVTVRNNTVYNNSQEGIITNNSADNSLSNVYIYGNILYNNSYESLKIEHGNQIYVWNNTVYTGSIRGSTTTYTECINNIAPAITGNYSVLSNNLIIDNADTMFINAQNYDFRLKKLATNAIDKGIDVGIAEDFDNNPIPFGIAPDIGAFEFVLRNPSDTLPDPPSNLTGIAPYYYQVELEWADSSDNEYGFEIERSLSSQTGYKKIFTTYDNITTYVDKSLSELTTYYYRVRAYNNIGYSGYSDEFSIATPAHPPPDAPSSLETTNIKARSVSLRWNDNSYDEDNFELERSNASGGEYTRIAVISRNNTYFTDSYLTPVTSYYYRIRACSEYGCSDYTDELGVTTLELRPPDNPPTDLTSTYIGKYSVTLNWTDNSSNEEGFYIYRSLTSGSGFGHVGTVGANVSQFTNSGLDPNTTYYYRVRAFNEDGASGYTNEYSLTTLELQPPAAPGSLSTSNITKTSVTLTWSDNSNDEGGFIIYRSLTSGDGFTQIGSARANVNQFLNYALDPDTRYYYIIIAYNEDGNSDPSNELDVTTLALQPPAAPGSLTSTDTTKNTVTLAWADNSYDEDGFIIYRSMTSGEGYVPVDSVNANINQFTDNGLNPETNYYYIIAAFNEDGNSDYSNEFLIRTLSLRPPEAPDNLSLSNITKNSASLEWTDNSESEEGFIVLRSLKTLAEYTEIARLDIDVTAYTDYGLLPDTSYSYVVFAFNEDGLSDSSNIIQVRTLPLVPPDAPSTLQAYATGYDWIELSWEDNASSELGYRIERTLDTITGFSDSIIIDAPDITQYTDTGLMINSEYYYRVAAYNNDGFSDYSGILRVMTLKLDPPVSPSSLSALQVTTNTVSLEWEDNSVNETGFVVERAIAPDKYFRTIHVINANTTSYTDNNLNPSTTYYYKVKAVNKAGKSNNSNTAIASTLSISESKRIWDGLIAYYNFNFNSDNIIYDNSNFGEPLNLYISDTSGIVWNETNKLELVSGNLIRSVFPATKVVNACKITNEITLEAWIKPSMFSSFNPANILSISNNSDDIGTTLAQEHISDMNKVFKYLIRLKTEATATNGEPILYSGDELSYLSLHHLVYVKNSDGIERLYINGKETASGIRPEGLENWDNSYYLTLGNDPDLNSPWNGTFYTVAIYNKAFTEGQITTNYNAGPKDNITNSVINYDIEISPNPSEGLVNIKIIPRSENELVEKTMIQVCDIMGDLKFQEIIEDPNREQIKSYNFSEFAGGIYIIRVISNDHFNSERFIVR
ncbi:MAG: fibronectin type III domain-containing protein [Bacteroidales bacterium]|nr:MAG: fibronectin type III domain-containing protein [Bacteroidales bacterium]